MKNKVILSLFLVVSLISAGLYFNNQEVKPLPAKVFGYPGAILVKNQIDSSSVATPEKSAAVTYTNPNSAVTKKGSNEQDSDNQSTNNSNNQKTYELKKNPKSVNFKNGVKYIGEKQIKLDIIDPTTGKNKVVSVMNLEIDNNYKQALQNRAKQIIAKANTTRAEFSGSVSIKSEKNYTDTNIILATAPKVEPKVERKVDLGMANVPVLDQGQYGTCATFAATAALDARMNAGDFISQQCTLELGVYLQKNNPEELSGWDGAMPDNVLGRLNKYGVFKNELCPHTYGNTTAFMSPSEYLTYTQSLWSDKINWKMIPEVPEHFSPTTELGKIKKALDSGHRIVLGAFLDIRKGAGDMIDANHPNGLWKLPPAFLLESYIKELFASNNASGHAVIITGYDDSKQLFKIRNSWGTTPGEDGDFYMTYDYYLQMSMDTQEIL